ESMLDLRKTFLSNIRRVGKLGRLEERQEAEVMAAVASSRVDLGKAEKEVSKAETDAAKKDVDAARAMLEVARLNYERAQVRAPFTGQIDKRPIYDGNYVEDKTTIVTMVDLSKLRLVGYIPEKAAPIAREMLRRETALRSGFLLGSTLAG